MMGKGKHFSSRHIFDLSARSLDVNQHTLSTTKSEPTA